MDDHKMSIWEAKIKTNKKELGTFLKIASYSGDSYMNSRR